MMNDKQFKPDCLSIYTLKTVTSVESQGKRILSLKGHQYDLPFKEISSDGGATWVVSP